MTRPKLNMDVRPMNLTLLLSADDINKSIDSISKRGKAIENDIHVTCVSIIAHTEKHGDITLANRLIDAIPNIARKNALRDWFQAFGKFTYSNETKELAFAKSKKTDTAEATVTPFWEFKPEADYVSFDLEKKIVSLVHTAMKRSEAKDKRDKISQTKLTQLKMLVKDQLAS